jgi:hypothetical protein
LAVVALSWLLFLDALQLSPSREREKTKTIAKQNTVQPFRLKDLEGWNLLKWNATIVNRITRRMATKLVRGVSRQEVSMVGDCELWCILGY